MDDARPSGFEQVTINKIDRDNFLLIYKASVTFMSIVCKNPRTTTMIVNK